jgi:hypothetical protein
MLSFENVKKDQMGGARSAHDGNKKWLKKTQMENLNGRNHS